jgi:predicted PurR-regulated permease PerM
MPRYTPGHININRLRSVFFFGLVGFFSLALLYIVRPIFYPIFWAAIVGIVFYPVFIGFRDFTKLPRISSILTILVAVVTIILPLIILSLLLWQQSIILYNSLSNVEPLINPAKIAWLENSPFAPYVETIKTQWTSLATNGSKVIATFFINNVESITQNSIRFIFLAFISLYTLYYFFCDGEKILDRLRHLSPLEDSHDTILYKRFTSTVRATLKGTFIVGGIQGFLGAILFWVTGVNGALIWGLFIFVLSIVPGLGSFIVWLPAGIIMLLLGNTWQGITILLGGLLIISTIDNILRPPLVGKDIQMHPLLVFFSTLGGIYLFGVPGFIIGPIIAALYLSTITIYDEYYLHTVKHSEE